ncbi:uncharacterized protein [Haliotis asinina]|uniref:uncharacterized protein n=1 Tax=Haliotis asinina TaxID=109174 RepID=UPI003531A6D2
MERMVSDHASVSACITNLSTQMTTYLMPTACLCVISLTLQASGDDCVHPPVHEVVPMKDHDYIRSIPDSSIYECASECKLLPLCLSFTFDEEQRACQLRGKTEPALTVGSGVLFSNIQQWKMPMTGACSQTSCGLHSRCIVGRNGRPVCEDSSALIGMKCTNDADCPVSMTLCFHGRCLCNPGYSHNIRSNSCDRDCKNYGDTMTWYQGLSISGNNRKSADVHGDLEHAKKMCMAACVQETSFICKTVDLGRSIFRDCCLSSKGYLDVSIEDRDSDEVFWILGVRGCQ